MWGGRVLFHTFLHPSISCWSQYYFRNIYLFQRYCCLTVQRMARSLLCSSFRVHPVSFSAQRLLCHLSFVGIIRRTLSRSDWPRFFTRCGQLSESEAEDDTGSHRNCLLEVTLLLPSLPSAHRAWTSVDITSKSCLWSFEPHRYQNIFCSMIMFLVTKYQCIVYPKMCQINSFHPFTEGMSL
jgi:hypothetical protein